METLHLFRLIFFKKYIWVNVNFNGYQGNYGFPTHQHVSVELEAIYCIQQLYTYFSSEDVALYRWERTLSDGLHANRLRCETRKRARQAALDARTVYFIITETF